MSGQEIAVFAGPSLREALPPGFKLLPPAKQGDVFGVARSRPLAIGLIDGYFEQAPAVWHKEILWALSQGIHVFGAASMGALRAAELQAYGMRGVGKIFERYLSKSTIDDDDVAVLHGPAELGYPLLTEAMVNVRETLGAAVAEGVLSPDAARGVEQTAKSIFYKERTWEHLLDCAKGTVGVAEFDTFAAWLPAGRIDLKQQDAKALVESLRDFAARPHAPFQADFVFEQTEHWEAASWQGAHKSASGELSEHDRLVLNEGFLADRSFRARLEGALYRLEVGTTSPAAVAQVSEADFQETYRAFRAENHLLNRPALDRWLAGVGMSRSTLERLLAEETQVSLALRARSTAVLKRLAAQLRLSASYEVLECRALKKQEAVRAASGSEGVSDLSSPPERLLWEWFFHSRLAREVPDDLEAYARDHAFEDARALLAVLQQEHLFLLLRDDEAD